MIRKLADQDLDIEEFAWQALGTPGAAGTPKHRPPPTAATVGGLDLNQDIAVLQRRIAELEAQQPAQLEQARKIGFDQGLKQGRQEAAAEMESALDRLASTIQDLAQVKRKVRGEAESELVRLALAIARRILHRELTADPQSLRGVVYAALQQLQNREITRIRVFPAAVPAVRAALERNGGSAAVEIVPDAMLQPGGLLFETSLGELDASVDTQLQEIERGFTDKLQLR